MADKDELIEITGDNGETITCELFDMVEFKNRYYALLVEESHAQDDEPELIIMRYREVGEEVFFQAITDDEEFKEVSEYVESLPGSDEE